MTRSRIAEISAKWMCMDRQRKHEHGARATDKCERQDMIAHMQAMNDNAMQRANAHAQPK